MVRLQDEAPVRKQRGKIVKMGLVLGLVRLLGVHGLDLEQREEPFLVLGRANLARDQVAGLQIKPAYLGRRDVNILGARQIIETLRAQEAKALGQDFQHALGKKDAAAFGVLLQDV